MKKFSFSLEVQGAPDRHKALENDDLLPVPASRRYVYRTTLITTTKARTIADHLQYMGLLDVHYLLVLGCWVSTIRATERRRLSSRFEPRHVLCGITALDLIALIYHPSGTR
jgi:hypothetical protein